MTPEELVTEQLYLYSRSIDDSFIVQKVLRPAGIELRRVTYLQLTEGILEMVKAGMGVSVLPKWSIANVIASRRRQGHSHHQGRRLPEVVRRHPERRRRRRRSWRSSSAC